MTVIQEAGAALDRRLASGGPADLIASNPAVRRSSRGKGRGSSATPRTVARLGLSVPAGVRSQDPTTVREERAALLAAKSMAIRAATVAPIAEGIQKFGLTERLEPDSSATARRRIPGEGAVSGIQPPITWSGARDDRAWAAGFRTYRTRQRRTVASSESQAAARRSGSATPEVAPLPRKTHMEPAKL